jgi:hypothetical protein
MVKTFLVPTNTIEGLTEMMDAIVETKIDLEFDTHSCLSHMQMDPSPGGMF